MRKTIAMLLALVVILCTGISTAFAEIGYELRKGDTDFDLQKLFKDEDQQTAVSDVIATYIDDIQDLDNGVITLEDLIEDDDGAYMLADHDKVGFSFGYTLEDIDNDGVPELIFATDDTDDSYFKCLVIALYKINKDGPELVFKSGERDRYYYAGGNKFAHVGSSGADDSFDTTEEYSNGKMKDIGQATDPKDYVQLKLVHYDPMEIATDTSEDQNDEDDDSETDTEEEVDEEAA